MIFIFVSRLGVRDGSNEGMAGVLEILKKRLLGLDWSGLEYVGGIRCS